MTKIIKLEVIDFIEGKTMVVDESPVVNDKDYIDVIQSPNKLKYLVDGEHNSITGINSYEELLDQAITNTLWNEWFYNKNGEDKTFTELKLSAPSVETEEGTIIVENIGNFINNGKWLVPSEEYQEIKKQLLEVASSEIKIHVKDISY